MKNRHSILFKLNIIFLIAFVAVLSTLGAFFLTKNHTRMQELLIKGPAVMRTYHLLQDERALKELLEKEQLIVIQGAEREEILREASSINLRHRIPVRPFDILHLNHNFYLHINTASFDLLILDKRASSGTTVLLLLLGMLILLTTMYLLLRRSLKPLKSLMVEVKNMGEGAVLEHLKKEQKDEVSILSNELYLASQRIDTLQRARKLFLRNMMHELKTPITKGKLLSELLNKDDPNHAIMENVFVSLDLLIDEMAHIEQVSSNSFTLEEAKENRIIDMIEQAKDLLFIESEIIHNAGDETLYCDFKMISIVFKNLIDNGVKHGDPDHFSIQVSAASVDFLSAGERLPHELSYYCEAFTKTDRSPAKGFGLGLYISQEIVKKHGFALEYTHSEGKNNFSLRF